MNKATIAMRRYNLNIYNAVILALILAALGGLGFCGYRVYDAFSLRLHWQVEPVIIHGYIIAAGMVERDPKQHYPDDIGISVTNGGCPRSTALWPIVKAEAYSVEGYQIDPSQYRIDGDYFSIVTPLNPDWVDTARQCNLDLLVSGDVPRAFSYGAFGSKQIKIISLEPLPEGKR